MENIFIHKIRAVTIAIDPKKNYRQIFSKTLTFQLSNDVYILLFNKKLLWLSKLPYTKRVCALKIIYEALLQLKLEAFERWLRKENKEDILLDYLESTELLQLINNFLSFNAAIHSCEHIFELFVHFDQSISPKLGPMALF